MWRGDGRNPLNCCLCSAIIGTTIDQSIAEAVSISKEGTEAARAGPYPVGSGRDTHLSSAHPESRSRRQALHRKLNRFAAYYDERRVHAGLSGRTPFQRCGKTSQRVANADAALHHQRNVGLRLAEQPQIRQWVAIDHEQVRIGAGPNAAQLPLHLQ